MQWRARLEQTWHWFWWNYYQLLIESCLEHQLKMKLNRKMEYHKLKLSAY